MQPYKIVICEDHAITADGLRVLISYRPEFSVVGQASNENELLPLLRESNPNILILDLNLGHQDGFTILTNVRKEFPTLRVLILTMYNEPTLVEKAKNLKANGYLLKNASNTELIDALHGVLVTDFYEDPKTLVSRKNGTVHRDNFIEKMKLTVRETELVKLLATGKDAKQISEELYLSLHTVRTHKKNILKKLALATTADLVRFAFENKLVQ